VSPPGKPGYITPRMNWQGMTGNRKTLATSDHKRAESGERRKQQRRTAYQRRRCYPTYTFSSRARYLEASNAGVARCGFSRLLRGYRVPDLYVPFPAGGKPFAVTTNRNG